MFIRFMNWIGFYSKSQVRENEKISFQAAESGWDKEAWFCALDCLIRGEV